MIGLDHQIKKRVYILFVYKWRKVRKYLTVLNKI